MIIRWTVQQPEESASEGEWKRASEWLSEWDENIDHHHHVISISVIIISRNCLPVKGQQWSSDGLSEVVISTSVCQRESKTESEQRLRERECVWWKEIVRRCERVGERVSDQVSEMKNIDHHHYVISISITIISRSYLPVMEQQWSSDGLLEVVISNLHDVTPNVWLCLYSVTCTVRTLVHVRNVPPESSMRARRSAISLMRSQICEAGISLPDKDQGLPVPKGYADIHKTYRMCCIPSRLDREVSKERKEVQTSI